MMYRVQMRCLNFGDVTVRLKFRTLFKMYSSEKESTSSKMMGVRCCRVAP
jgi:hypothetical protein